MKSGNTSYIRNYSVIFVIKKLLVSEDHNVPRSQIYAPTKSASMNGVLDKVCWEIVGARNKIRVRYSSQLGNHSTRLTVVSRGPSWGKGFPQASLIEGKRSVRPSFPSFNNLKLPQLRWSRLKLFQIPGFMPLFMWHNASINFPSSHPKRSNASSKASYAIQYCSHY